MTLFTSEHLFASTRVYDGSIINLRVDTLRTDGKEVTREVVEHRGGVVILCQPEPNHLVLIKQYRYSVNENLIELPAGRIEKDEEPSFTAKRELREETGYQAKDWQEIARFFTAPGFCNEMLYAYLATNVELYQKELDEDEETEVMVVTLAKATQLAVEGKIRDAKTLAGIGLLWGLSSSACP